MECPEDTKNLGIELSAADIFQDDFPPVLPRGGNPVGFDNRISFFVCGSFTSLEGAEIEGKIVVLENFIVKENGVNSLVRVGVGSHIVPEGGQVVMTGKC